MHVARRSIRVVQPHIRGTRRHSQVSIKEKISAGISSLTHDVFQHVPSSDASKDATIKVYNRMKGTILELMARNMSKTDQEFLLKQWGQTKEIEKKIPDENDMSIKTEPEIGILSSVPDDTIPHNFPSTSTPILTIPDVSEMVADSATEMKAEEIISEMQSKSEPDSSSPIVPTTSLSVATDSTTHPIFGQLLADIGYKKVYLTSARRLVLAQVWQKQRTLRPERSAGIALVKLPLFSLHVYNVYNVRACACP